ncbi:hypothetical protein KC19_1G107100 [Ceratodon purpureus]|uniref:HNH nuclease domain-containing protein n=1 Tax=Ceratodon purpureus TaxID=3225 RepID=A0A8T0J4R2_CERPU|nr:hypothetical protein KC19_1G107100 [Ceratodon purpureus]
MSLIKTQTLHIHSSCLQHLLPDRDIYQSLQHRGFHSAVLSSLQVGDLNGVLRRPRRIVTRAVIEGRETKVKRHAHHGNGKQKKKVEQQNGKGKPCDSSNGALRTDSLSMGNSNLAPADFCNVEDDLDGLDDDDELQIFRALVLDLSYRPVNVVNWKRALCLEILEKADVLEYYDQAILSTQRAYYLPAVLRVSSFVHTPKNKKVKLTLNRNNIFLRDKFRCQYCNKRGEDLTIDHVLAASRGGGWEWENLVTACASCNVKKGDKSLEECRMKLLKPPREPKELDSMDLPPNYRTFRSLHRNKGTPTEWLDYLPNKPFHI